MASTSTRENTESQEQPVDPPIRVHADLQTLGSKDYFIDRRGNGVYRVIGLLIHTVRYSTWRIEQVINKSSVEITLSVSLFFWSPLSSSRQPLKHYNTLSNCFYS